MVSNAGTPHIDDPSLFNVIVSLPLEEVIVSFKLVI
jgi:hypothetical protein